MNLIIVGESGSGKDTVLQFLKDAGYRVILSHTTRNRRDGEGETYIFSDKETFQKHLDARAIYEFVEFGGNYYWTLYGDYMQRGKWCLITETIGARKLRYEQRCKIIYIKTDELTRTQRVGSERTSRDKNKFVSFPADYIVENESTIDNLKYRLGEAIDYLETIDNDDPSYA